VGRSGQDNLTRVASGLLAGAVVAVIGASGVIWWYRQAAFGWSPPSPRLWHWLSVAAVVLAAAALVLAVIAAIRRTTRAGRIGAITWAVLAGAILIAAPTVVHREAPKGHHAVVVAVDATTGDVRWRVTTPGWSLRALAVTGDVVTMLTVGGDTEPCRDVLRRLTLGVAEGATLRFEDLSTSAAQYPPSDFTVRDGYLVHLDGAKEGWKVALAPLGVTRAGYVVAGSGVVVVSGDGVVPLKCRG
jgi:hypothetical protein